MAAIAIFCRVILLSNRNKDPIAVRTIASDRTISHLKLTSQRERNDQFDILHAFPLIEKKELTNGTIDVW